MLEIYEDCISPIFQNFQAVLLLMRASLKLAKPYLDLQSSAAL